MIRFIEAQLSFAPDDHRRESFNELTATPTYDADGELASVRIVDECGEHISLTDREQVKRLIEALQWSLTGRALESPDYTAKQEAA